MTATRLTAIWQGTTFTSLEHCRVDIAESGITVDGLVVAMDGGPIRLHYGIACDPSWTVRRLAITELETGTDLTFLSDGNGHWTDGAGRSLPAFDGCVDVDLTATPFTNTLPIRRLALRPGESRDLRMLYVLIPGMAVESSEQRYTCLDAGATGGRYRYDSGDFTVDLPVDRDGLVVDYPGFWRRVAL
jgi:hypothetical protein